MQTKHKVILISTIVAIAIMSFFCGFYVGNHYKFYKKHKNAKTIKFYQTKKYAGQELSEKEKKDVEVFVLPYETCIRRNLDKQDRNIVLNIQKEVIELAKDNNKIKFKINDLKSAKDNKRIIDVVKKCQKQTYKAMKKDEVKNFKKAIKKLKMVDIISIFHGIK